jgi:hypothetical protein
MKILNYVSLKLITIAIACSFAASPPLQAGEARWNSTLARPEYGARLIVARAANLATFENVNLFVDGVQVANLGFLRSYEAVLPPGRHVLSVNKALEHCRHTIVDAQPGMTYAFTAFSESYNRVYLQSGNGASKKIVATGMPPAATVARCSYGF